MLVTLLLAALSALAPISVTPAHQELLSWQGLCSGKMNAYAPGHKDNRRMVVTLSDESGTISESEIDLSGAPERGQSLERTFVLREGQVYVITAWLYGPSREKVRGSAIGSAHCS